MVRHLRQGALSRNQQSPVRVFSLFFRLFLSQKCARCFERPGFSLSFFHTFAASWMHRRNQKRVDSWAWQRCVALLWQRSISFAYSINILILSNGVCLFVYRKIMFSISYYVCLRWFIIFVLTKKQNKLRLLFLAINFLMDGVSLQKLPIAVIVALASKCLKENIHLCIFVFFFWGFFLFCFASFFFKKNHHCIQLGIVLININALTYVINVAWFLWLGVSIGARVSERHFYYFYLIFIFRKKTTTTTTWC